MIIHESKCLVNICYATKIDQNTLLVVKNIHKMGYFAYPLLKLGYDGGRYVDARLLGKLLAGVACINLDRTGFFNFI